MGNKRIPYLVSDNGDRYALDRNGRLTIGSGNDDIYINGGQVLAGHAVIYSAGDNVRIQIGSGEVWLNSRRVERLTRVEENDQIQLGQITLVLTIEEPHRAARSSGQVSSTPSTNTGSSSIFSTTGNAFDSIENVMEDPVLPEAPAIQQTQSSSHGDSSTPVTTESESSEPVIQSSPTPQLPSTISQLIPKGSSTPVPAQRNPIQNRTIFPANFTHDQRHLLLKEYFADAMIYRPKPDGDMEFNLFERWGRTRNATGRTWVLLTEGLKLAAKMNQAMADSQRQQVADATYVDDVIRESIFELIEKAMHELQIFDADLVRDPLVIYGPIFWRASGIPIENICARQGHDGFMRFSAQEVSIILLTDDQVGVYKCNLDTITGRPGQQIADAYFYSDITSVSIRDTDVMLPLDEEKKEITIHAFRLGVTGGETVQVSLSSPAIRDIFQSDVYEDPEHRKTVRVLQQMWRTKKRQ